MENYNQLLDQMREIIFSNDEYDLEDAIEAFDPRLISIPFTNETIKNKFLKDLGDEVQEIVEQTSQYSPSGFSNIINNNTEISSLPSRGINHNLENFFKDGWISDHKEFITILREIQLCALESEKRLVKQLSELLNGENENTFIGLNTKRNLHLLEGEIRQVNYQKQLNELLEENRELVEKARSGEIDKITYSKQDRINQAEIEYLSIMMEKSEKFTSYNTAALCYRMDKFRGEDNVYAKEEYHQLLYEYKKLEIERSLKEDELSYIEGYISKEEYNAAELDAQRKMEILEKTIENRKAKLSNFKIK